MNRIPDFVNRPEIFSAVCTELLALAAAEEDEAIQVAQATPYWSQHPRSVTEHRAAAHALRSEVERLRAAARDFSSSHEASPQMTE
ncbi:hypothetical protein JCM18899A_52840 [Nocardioides sp. AN3]